MDLNDKINARRPGAFARMASARGLFRRIQGHIENGGKVVVVTYTRATRYSKPEHFKLSKDQRAVLAMAGRSFVDISYAGIQFTR